MGGEGASEQTKPTNKQADSADLVPGNRVTCLAPHESPAKTPSVSEASANDPGPSGEGSLRNNMLAVCQTLFFFFLFFFFRETAPSCDRHPPSPALLIGIWHRRDGVCNGSDRQGQEVRGLE